jgi:uncharacterized protein
MPGKFVVKQSKKGFQFNLIATNGKVIVSSAVYPTRRNCMLGIESVRKNAPGATVVEESTPVRGAAKKTAGNGTPGRAAAKSAVKTAAPTTAAQAGNGTRRGRAAKAAPATPAPAKRASRTTKRASST